MCLTVLPLYHKRMVGRFDVFESLVDALHANQASLQSGDVVVISTKFVSVAQGRLVDASGIRSAHACKLSKKFHLQPDIAEIILRESDEVFGGVAGFVIASSGGILAPNAGIDRSNAKGMVVLYPNEPYTVAEQIHKKVFLKFQIHVGVILVDSRLMPARVGTSGVAVACAGIEPVLDMRARKDLDGNPLKVTFQATADNLATVANYMMGEGPESRPFAIVRNSNAVLTSRKIALGETSVPLEQCVYVRGISGIKL